MGQTKRGKGTQLLAVADRAGLPLAVRTESATPHEVTLVVATLEDRLVAAWPTRLIGDRAYDSDPLDACLRELGIDMMAPHRRNRTKPKTQDGRALAPLQATLESRAPLRLVGQLPAAGGPL